MHRFHQDTSTNWNDKKRLVFILAASGTCLLAWLMFFFHIRYESMWRDEWFSWRYSQMNPLEMTRSTALDVHPPLYYTLLWLWTGLTQSQDLLVMRLMSAFPALLAVAVSYRLGRDWFKNGWAGLGAAAFLATSGILVYYARELRMYGLVVLLAAASWWYLWRWLHYDGRSARIGYIVLVALMLYTYYFSGFVVLTQLIFVAILYRRRLFRLVRLLVVSSVLFLPWLPTVFNQIVIEQGISKRGELFGKYSATAPTTFPNIGTFINTYTAYQPGLVLLLALLAMLLAYQTGVSSSFRRWVIAAAFWFFLTITIFFGLNLWFPIYNLRYPLPIITGLALLTGVTITLLPGNRTRIAVMILVIVMGMGSHFNAFLPAKAPHRDMLQIIAAGYLPGDRIWYNMDPGARGSGLTVGVDYHLQFDAPQLLKAHFVWDAPKDYQDSGAVRRVWDARPYWIQMPDDARAELVKDRVLSEEYMIGAYAVRLYEAAPRDQSPVTLSNGDRPLFALLASPPARPVYHAGETVITKTWWQVLDNSPIDYSYTLILRRVGEDATLYQSDAGLTSFDKRPTSQWPIDSHYLLAMPSLQLPDKLPPGQYEIWLGAYYWENPTRLGIDGGGETSIRTDPLDLALVAAFEVR